MTAIGKNLPLLAAPSTVGFGADFDLGALPDLKIGAPKAPPGTHRKSTACG